VKIGCFIAEIPEMCGLHLNSEECSPGWDRGVWHWVI